MKQSDASLLRFRSPFVLSGAAVLLALSAIGCSGGDGNGDSGGVGGTAGSGSGGAGGMPSNCKSNGATAEMVSVPAGEFLMGCNGSVDTQCEDKEKPGRTITLKAFQIDKTEVTQDQYLACVEAGQCSPPSCPWECSNANFPASCVKWNDAKAFCAWAGKRLPSEAEWEKAARGTDGRKYPWGNSEPTCSNANMAGCAGAATAAGSFASGASPFGALDMAGNMVEMVNDWYDETYYQRAPDTDPTGPAAGTQYVGRGGGWKSEPFWLRASVRDWYVATDAGGSLGFRCAK
jgi:formylglycine-generating enzyme required for sulfatase activity